MVVRDALGLIGATFGGPGADHIDAGVFLQQDEYISGFELRYGDILTARLFYRSKDNKIGVARARGVRCRPLVLAYGLLFLTHCGRHE
jgi:hypothetical protein